MNTTLVFSLGTLKMTLKPTLSLGPGRPPLLGLLRQPGRHADDGRGEEEPGGEVEGVLLVPGVVHQPPSYWGT